MGAGFFCAHVCIQMEMPDWDWATIHNGDIVFGDIDGVLIIPKEIAPEVIEKALIKASTEKTMRKAIEDGMMVTEAFAKFGVL